MFGRTITFLPAVSTKGDATTVMGRPVLFQAESTQPDAFGDRFFAVSHKLPYQKEVY
jgi:hypothetical protein